MYAGQYFSVDRNFQCMDLFRGLSIGVNDKANEDALRPHVNLEPKFAALVYVAPEEVCAAGFVCTKSGVWLHRDSAAKLQADLQSHLVRCFCQLMQPTVRQGLPCVSVILRRTGAVLYSLLQNLP